MIKMIKKIGKKNPETKPGTKKKKFETEQKIRQKSPESQGTEIGKKNVIVVIGKKTRTEKEKTVIEVIETKIEKERTVVIGKRKETRTEKERTVVIGKRKETRTEKEKTVVIEKRKETRTEKEKSVTVVIRKRKGKETETARKIRVAGIKIGKNVTRKNSVIEVAIIGRKEKGN